jgi:protein-tyrosine phosphatase
MPSVVFVCTANVCRSPVAEALFRDWLRRRGVVDEWRVSSAGTWARDGAPVPPALGRLLQARGLDLSGHRARRVTEGLLAASDLTLCMTQSHCEALRIEFATCASRVKMLSEFAGRAYDVPDPCEGREPDYRVLISEITQLIEVGGPRIVAAAQNGN